MDINFLRGIGTLMALIAFLGVCAWAYSGRSKAGFDEAANLPFADDHDTAGAPKGASSLNSGDKTQ